MEKLAELIQREFDPKQTIQLLRASGSIFWSWGVSKIRVVPNKALLLRVHGHHHNGWVLIVLAWNDTYTVHYLNQRYRVLDSSEEIYFDMLVDEIDRRVERIDSYK